VTSPTSRRPARPVIDARMMGARKSLLLQDGGMGFDL